MIQILFATVTGNSENTAKHIEKRLLEKGVGSIQIERTENVEVESLTPENTYIVVASTWNLGEMNQFLKHLFDELENVDLNKVKMAFVGLGDKIYGEEHYCKSIKDFREKALRGGVDEIIEPLFVDGEPEMQFESLIDPWIDKLFERVR